MARKKQELLGTILVEIEDRAEQKTNFKVDVIGEGKSVTLGYPYNHLVHPSNVDSREGWVREMRLLVADSLLGRESKLKDVRLMDPWE